jgi:hypothetical protein
MKTLLSLLLALLAIVAVAEAAPSDDLRGYCASQWPADYRMQVHCVNQEASARNDVGRWSNAESEVYAYCYYQWDSWRMVAHCGRQQLGARRQLQQMPVTPPGCVDYGKTRVCG